MPLVILAGQPCTGKTTFANLLRRHLEGQEEIHKIVVINEENLSIKKFDAYRDSLGEKKARGSIKSAVDHALEHDCVVIVDSLNYIKGYRYELFCIARSLRTAHCCVWVECDEASSAERSAARNESGVDNYDPTM
jgi:protein KTI12